MNNLYKEMVRKPGDLCFEVSLESDKGLTMTDLSFALKFFVYGHPKNVCIHKDDLEVVEGKYYAVLNEHGFVNGVLFCEAEIVETINGINRIVSVRSNTGYMIGNCCQPSVDTSSCAHGYSLSLYKVEYVPQPIDPNPEEDQLVAEELFGERLSLPELTADRAIADEHGNRIADTYETRQAVRNHIRAVYNEQFIENPPLILDEYITPSMLSEGVKDMLSQAGATINNVPDGEDLTTKQGVLKLSDKTYNPGAYSGLGRVYLRKNLVGGQNLLTQAMVSKPNTIYILQYDYTIDGKSITIPEGCVLSYEGGSIRDGHINYTDTLIEGVEKTNNVITTGVNHYLSVPVDEEDITSSNGKILKFKDKDYLPEMASGMGRVYLRKNFVEGKNILTQELINKPNTIYIIQYNYDLNGKEITIPENSVLQFEGGSLNNGTITLCSNVKIIGKGEKLTKIYINHVGEVRNIHITNIELCGDKAVDGDITCAISSKNYMIAHNITIENCRIHGYNTGISINGNNATISNNTLYDNGHKDYINRDYQVDIMFNGQYTKEVDTKNNIIKNNRCLSYYVDRHIDGGENFYFSNIIIDGNICITCDEQGENEIFESDYVRHCILVGYTGTSSREKQAIITNNICKCATWTGIYIRANNTESTADTSKYVTIITNNIIEHIYGKSSNDTPTGINVEVKEGSIISNNIISDIGGVQERKAAAGIDIGFVLSKGHTYVYGNFVKNANAGIINDSFAKRVDICNNRIVSCNSGISINETERDETDKHGSEFCNINYNIIRDCKIGICCDNNYSDFQNIKGNTITGYSKEEKEHYGIYIRQRQNNMYPLFIINNTISFVSYGIYKTPNGFLRNESFSQFFDYNNFVSCGTAFFIGVNSANQLFIVEGNTYKDCTRKFDDQSWSRCVYDGQHHSDGIYTIYDNCDRGDITNTKYGYITSAQVCFFNKKFRKGDTVIPVNSSRFTKAVCQEDYVSNSDSGSSWLTDNARLTSQQSKLCEVEGQVIYDTTLKKIKYYIGSKWVDATGAEV